MKKLNSKNTLKSLPGIHESIFVEGRVKFDTIQRLLTSLVITAFLLALLVTAVHHHGNKTSHADCPLCLFLAQPVVTDFAKYDFVYKLSVLFENAPVLTGSSALFCIKSVSPSRAPPCRKV